MKNARFPQDGQMEQENLFVTFDIDGQRIAIRCPLVDRVVHAVEVTRLPESPPLVLGIIKVGNEVIPVINLRKLFGLKEKEVEPSDQFILAHANRRKVALVVDFVEGIVEASPSQMVSSGSIFPGLNGVEGVFNGGENVVIVEDLESLLLKHEGLLSARVSQNTSNAPEIA